MKFHVQMCTLTCTRIMLAQVILPMGDMPPTSAINKETRELIDDAVNGNPMPSTKKAATRVLGAKGATTVDGTTVKLINQVLRTRG